MNNKLIGTIILTVGILLLAGIIYSFFFSNIFSDDFFGFLRRNQGPAETRPTGTDAAGDNEIPRDVKRVVLEERDNNINTEDFSYEDKVITFNKEELIHMAASFAERFGTYSNQSNYGNIVSLKIFMSDKMKVWADSFLDEKRMQERDIDIYYGITTKAVSKEMLEYDDDLGRASILVNTRRREAVSSTNNISNTFGQDITISLVKEKGSWKVDSANWEEEQ